MIVTVTLNLALDVTYRVPRLTPGATHRVTVDQRAGGKGVNVARVLRALGEDAAVCGFAGGGTGRLALAELEAAAIPRGRSRSRGRRGGRSRGAARGAAGPPGSWGPG